MQLFYKKKKDEGARKRYKDMTAKERAKLERDKKEKERRELEKLPRPNLYWPYTLPIFRPVAFDFWKTLLLTNFPGYNLSEVY